LGFDVRGREFGCWALGVEVSGLKCRGLSQSSGFGFENFKFLGCEFVEQCSALGCYVLLDIELDGLGRLIDRQSFSWAPQEIPLNFARA